MIILTGQGDQKVDIEAMQVGASDYLVKDQINSNLLERSIRYSLEHYKDKKALQASENRYRKFFEMAPLGIFQSTPQGQYKIVNPAFASTFGFESPEEMSEHVKNISSLYTDSKQREEVKRLLRENGKLNGYEIEVKHKNGEIIHLSIYVKCVYDEFGKILYYDGYTLNLTKQKLFEERLQQSQKMEAIATLAGGIAHQFNNALSPIVGYLELLKMDLESEGISIAYISTMQEATERMAKLTNQLLAYAQGGKYQVQAVSLSSLIRDTLSFLEYNIPHFIHVDIDLEQKISIKADPAQIQMVISAILQNAYESIGDATNGRIKISLKNRRIDKSEISSQEIPPPGFYAYLAIEDNGKGMDRETAKRIFDPFFTTKLEGRGLGMAASYGIIKNHNGYIAVKSELGKGTIIQVYLPMTEKKRKRRKISRLKPSLKSATVLLIEDEKMVMRVNRRVLENLGHRVLEASSGKEAIEVVKNFDGQIDIVLLDIKLPDIQGQNLYPILMELRPDLKVIVCSGYSLDGAAKEIMNAGAQAFIQKPFLIHHLSEKLEEILKA